jgi:hypothetical protein
MLNEHEGHARVGCQRRKEGFESVKATRRSADAYDWKPAGGSGAKGRRCAGPGLGRLVAIGLHLMLR